MTDVKFTFPVQGITGKIDEEHKISFRTRFGKTHAYRYRPTKQQIKTEAQIAYRQTFTTASQQAKAELQIPERRAFWEDQFKKQKRYVRLDCFVVAQLIKQR